MITIGDFGMSLVMLAGGFTGATVTTTFGVGITTGLVMFSPLRAD